MAEYLVFKLDDKLKSHLEEFDLLRQEVMQLKKGLSKSIGEMRSKIDKEIKPRIDKLEANITGEVPVMDDEKKKGLAKEILSIDVKNNTTHIEVKYKNIEEVSEECLEGLSFIVKEEGLQFIMKNCGDVSLHHCFEKCEKLTTLNFPLIFNTSSVTDMARMFYGCRSLTSLDLSTFDTSSVTNMNSMFYGCSNLSSLNLSTFDTSSVRDMGWMFRQCKTLTSLDLSTFNTSSVTNMNSMFWGCSSLTSLDLSSFDTSNVQDMSEMFHLCQSLKTLDLSKFNTSSVWHKFFGIFGGCKGMFGECSGLKDVYVKDKKIKSKLPSHVSIKTK